jgi:pilus assembly protein Flp/PilA
MSTKLHDLIHRVYLVCEASLEREEGQDLVEYALVVALIAFGAVAGMNALAGGINTAFKDVSSSLLKNI